jgi:hypothetical protein
MNLIYNVRDTLNHEPEEVVEEEGRVLQLGIYIQNCV